MSKMESEFLIIHKDVLPPCYEEVVEAVRLINVENKSVSEACKELDISRSTFYKYKDKVFALTADYGRKAIISFKVGHEKGVLSNILNAIAECQGNVLTINQDMPIHGLAYVTVTIDAKDLTVSVYDLISELKKLHEVLDANLVALE